MHQQLRELFDRSVEVFQADPRVLGGLNFGSVGKKREDELSDVDPVFIVRDEDFEGLDADLPEIFRGFGLPILLWWPESCNSDDFRNYAIFLQGRELLQYDINIMKASLLDQDTGRWTLAQCEPQHILFDKAGLLSDAFNNRMQHEYCPSSLLWNVERYWIYVFIHVKYLRRSDTLKLAYAQDMLFQSHLEVMRALYPGVFWSWWPDVVQRLRPEHKEALSLYLGAADADSVGRVLPLQIDCFARDARLACARYELTYPDGFEDAVRSHLSRYAPQPD
jgi:predicted nucleotidyltransferase